jgi:hypothetical protein
MHTDHGAGPNSGACCCIKLRTTRQVSTNLVAQEALSNAGSRAHALPAELLAVAELLPQQVDQQRLNMPTRVNRGTLAW